jgi:hypothetical protein
MARFLAFCEGRGRPVSRTGSENFGAKASTGTWRVRAQVEAATYRHAGGAFDCLSLELQALTDSGGKAHGGVRPHGMPLLLWSGTEAEALDLAGANGPFRQAVALLQAERSLKAKRQRLENTPEYAQAEKAHRLAALDHMAARKAALVANGGSA